MYLGYVMGSTGDFRRAGDLHREALALFPKLGHRPRAALTLFFVGLVALSGGACERGVTLVAAAESTSGFLLTRLSPSQGADREAQLADACRTLGDPASDTAWDRGSALAFEQAVSVGLSAEGAPEPAAH